MLTFKKPMWLLVPVAVVAGYLWGRARPRFRHSIRTSLFKQYGQHAAAATVYPSMTYVGQPLGTIRREIEHGRVSTIEVIQGHDPLRPNTVLHVSARLRDGTGIALE